MPRVEEVMVSLSVQTMAALMEICSFLAPENAKPCFKELRETCERKRDVQECVNEYVDGKLTEE